MNKKFMLSVLVLLLFTSMLASACSNNNAESGKSSQPANTKESAEPNASGSGKEIEPADPLGRYETPVIVNQVLGYNAPEDPTTPSGTTPETNGYVKELEKMLNIKVNYLWTVPSDQFEQKFSLSLASGDLPDVMSVDLQQFGKFKKQGILADLSEAYEKYASPELKAFMESDGGKTLNTFRTEDGKLLGLPSFGDPYLSTQLLWIRTDWLKNLSLEAPKTIDELEKVAEMFVNDDPDRNGKKDTYGLALQKELNYWGFDLKGYFNAFGAYPKSWIKGTDGKLVAGEIQPETKEALTRLHAWYKKGILNPEFGILDENKVVEDLVAGKVGISYGEWWYPAWPLATTMEKDPKAEWQPFMIPGLAGTGKSLVPSLRLSSVTVVNEKFSNPEAAVKMLNFYIELNTKKKYRDTTRADQGFVYNWFEPRMINPMEFETIYTEVNRAIAGKTNTDAYDGPNSKEVAKVFEATEKWTAGNGAPADWGLYYSRAAEDGGYGLTRQIRDSGQTVSDEFYGTPTETMVKYGAQFDKMFNETFTEIIMKGDLAKFDEYVNNWKTLGGDKMTEEVNAWYAENVK